MSHSDALAERSHFRTLLTLAPWLWPKGEPGLRSRVVVSLLFLAALALRDGRPDAGFQVSAAKRTAALAATDNARADVQIHGGMGFTWENDAHLFLTRSHLLAQVFGTPYEVRSAMLATAPAMP